MVTGLLIGQSPYILSAQMRMTDAGQAFGRADKYGYARYSYKLSDVEVAPGVVLPVNLVFTSDPGREPGLFGPGWYLPLFDSTVVISGQTELVWRAPDELIHFFAKGKDRGLRGEDIYNNPNWKAQVQRNGVILIASVNDPLWAFEYKDGRLTRFRMGKDSESLRISYLGGHLSRVVAEKSGRVLIDVQTHSSVPSKVLFDSGKTQVSVKMGDGDMLSPDGRTSYRALFLRELVMDEQTGKGYRFEYERAGKGKRLTGMAEKRREVGVFLNRVKVSDEKSQVKSATWEAISGYIVSDESTDYEVVNGDYDPHIAADGSVVDHGVQRRRDTVPGGVRIKRKYEGGKEGEWSYNWGSGVMTENDPVRNRLVRHTFIMSQGPAHLKLRKTERLVDGGWKTVDLRNYDSNGRIIRKILDGGGMEVWERDEAQGMTRSNRYGKDGQLIWTSLYKGSQERLVERTVFRENGDQERYSYDQINGLQQVKHWLNGELQWKKKLHADYRLAEVLHANGEWMKYEYLDNGVRMYRANSEGVVTSFFRENGSRIFSPSN